MALEFQFAFLGPEHNYVASLTRTSSNGIPQDKSATVEFYGLPTSFCDQYRTRLALPRYMYNIRGHDFLSYVGQWKSSTGDGPLDANANLYNEIDEIQILATEEELKFAQIKRKANLIASFGPSSDSFFVDAFRQKRYRWRNLPVDLDDEIQKIVCDHGWVKEGKGKIWDVGINADGGWVVQFDKGATWRLGGELPRTLKTALDEAAQRKGISISRLFLNHQHPTEYVLLFSDGAVHAQLHEGFKVPLRRLLQRWLEARARRIMNSEGAQWFNFHVSCECTQKEQAIADAAYYGRRGVFHLVRGNAFLAYKYLREADKQNPFNFVIQGKYVKALRAVRNSDYDPVLEDRLCCANHLARQSTSLSGAFHGKDDEKKDFRHDYVWAIGMLRKTGDERTEKLAKELEGGRAQVLEMLQGTGVERGWSYEMGRRKDEFSAEEMRNASELRAETAAEVQMRVPELA